MSANEIQIQSDKSGIAEDAVSVVVADAVVYLPMEELVDFEQELERLTKEEARLTKELARVNGMLNNEKFISKAPEAKINEERAKLEKYTQMMEQVQERLKGLRKETHQIVRGDNETDSYQTPRYKGWHTKGEKFKAGRH